MTQVYPGPESIFSPATRHFVWEYSLEIDQVLSPHLPVFEETMRKLTGASGRLLQLRFERAPLLWEKFFWVAIARYWHQNDIDLPQAIRLAEADIRGLAQRFAPHIQRPEFEPRRAHQVSLV